MFKFTISFQYLLCHLIKKGRPTGKTDSLEIDLDSSIFLKESSWPTETKCVLCLHNYNNDNPSITTRDINKDADLTLKKRTYTDEYL